jgi:hypothetical protein
LGYRTLTIKERLLNAASYCYLGITDTVTEDIDSKSLLSSEEWAAIPLAKSFKTAIYVCCGGLKLCPQ